MALAKKTRYASLEETFARKIGGKIVSSVPKPPKNSRVALPRMQDRKDRLEKDGSPKAEDWGKGYEAKCMCGWRGFYANPYSASLACKIHAEKWCKIRSEAKGTGALDCYYCGKRYENFGDLADHVQVVHFGRKRKMNVGAYTQNGQAERLPLLDAKMFKKLQDKRKKVVAKILAVRQINSPKFQGLAMDLKSGAQKVAFLTRFDRWDIGAIAAQLGSEETDDWIGGTLCFVTKQGEKGTFVNVERPKAK